MKGVRHRSEASAVCAGGLVNHCQHGITCNIVAGHPTSRRSRLVTLGLAAAAAATTICWSEAFASGALGARGLRCYMPLMLGLTSKIHLRGPIVNPRYVHRKGVAVCAKKKKKNVDPEIERKRREAALKRAEATAKAAKLREQLMEQQAAQTTEVDPGEDKKEEEEEEEDGKEEEEEEEEAKDEEEKQDGEETKDKQQDEKEADMEKGSKKQQPEHEVKDAKIELEDNSQGSLQEAELMSKTVKELKELLREKGLRVSGKKCELVQRMLLATSQDPESGSATPRKVAKFVKKNGNTVQKAKSGKRTGRRAQPKVVKKRLFPYQFVDVRWEDNEWYSGMVTWISFREGKASVVFDEDATKHICNLEDIRPRSVKIAMSDLEVGMKFCGTVKQVVQMGAYVDIGTERSGLVRLCRMADHWVEKSWDAATVGDEVDVWVYRVPVKTNFLGLSMLECAHSTLQDPVEYFREASAGDWFEGVVSYTAPSGIFVDVELPSEGGGGSVQGIVPTKLVEEETDSGDPVQVQVTRVMPQDGILLLSAMRPSQGS